MFLYFNSFRGQETTFCIYPKCFHPHIWITDSSSAASGDECSSWAGRLFKSPWNELIINSWNSSKACISGKACILRLFFQVLMIQFSDLLSGLKVFTGSKFDIRSWRPPFMEHIINPLRQLFIILCISQLNKYVKDLHIIALFFYLYCAPPLRWW